MNFQYKKVLLIGATSGIGHAFAERLIEQHISVVAVGRRKDRLEALVKAHGKDKVDFIVHDINDLDNASSFAKKAFLAHPDIDFVYLNSGIQRGFDFTKPETINLAAIDQELSTNYTAPVHLTVAILPHLTSKSTPTALAFTSSQLGIVTLNRSPNYSASKAAIHSFVMALREQLKDAHPKLRVIEVYPPAVQTEMHNSDKQPDLKNGDKIGMSLEDFTNELWQKLQKGDDQIPVGSAKEIYDAVEPTRQGILKEFNAKMAEALKDFTA